MYTIYTYKYVCISNSVAAPTALLQPALPSSISLKPVRSQTPEIPIRAPFRRALNRAVYSLPEKLKEDSPGFNWDGSPNPRVADPYLVVFCIAEVGSIFRDRDFMEAPK